MAIPSAITFLGDPRTEAERAVPVRSLARHRFTRKSAMKSACQRFGKLAYVRRTEKTATNMRVLRDVFVGHAPL